MDRKRVIVFLVICLCVALATGFPSGQPNVTVKSANAAANKSGGGGSTGGKVDPTAASIQFWDRGDDQIKSDGLGPYVNGGSITCQVQQNYPNGEILLNMAKVSGLKRYLWYDFRNALNTACDTDASGPTGIIKDTGFIAIMNAADVPIHTTVARIGIFYTSVGYFRFRTKPDNLCSFAVVVSRLNQTTWTVTTDAPDPANPLLQASDGSWVPVGNQAQLGDGADFQGNYRMSFGMTVTCPGCSK